MSDIASEQGAEAPQAPDTSAPAETTPQGLDMDALRGVLSEHFDPRFERLESRLPEAEPEPEPDPYAPLMDQMGYSEEEATATRQALDPIIEAAVQQRLDQRIGPLEQGFTEVQAERMMDRVLISLEREFPALQDDAVAEPVIKAVHEYVEKTGNRAALGDPQIYKWAYLEKVALERASQEQPAGRPGAELERPGGASPPEPEPDVNEQILGAGNGNSDFWGWGGPR